VLEEIRMLGNFENRGGKLLQVILAGQPEFDRKLDAPNLRQLKQRVVLRCNLRPFSEVETIEYINTRLEKAGSSDQAIFPTEVMAEIFVRSQGIPRVVNAICDNVLLLAFALETQTATLEMVDEVTTDMRLEWPGRRLRSRGGEEALRPQFSRGD
jgi:general secretion pathway protein A